MFFKGKSLARLCISKKSCIFAPKLMMHGKRQVALAKLW